MIFMSSQIWNRLIPSVTCRTLISFFSVVFLFSVISGHPKGRSVVPCPALCFYDLYVFSDPESFDPLGQLPDVEIDQETNRAAGELEV